MIKKRKIIFKILSIITLFCFAFIIFSKLKVWKSEKTIDTIKKEKIKDDIGDIPINFEAIWEINQDVVAWIKIPNTTVDYPILQSPHEDDYYLYRDINQIKGKIPGSIYINLNNSPKLTDNNTIIYGHNVHMSNDKGKGSMFGDLEKYYDETFFKGNKEIIIYTPKNIYTYEIFAAVTYHNKLIPALYNLDKKDGYQSFLNSLYKTNNKKDNYSDKIVTTKDKIITLSTCPANHSDLYRYLIVAVLIKEE